MPAPAPEKSSQITKQTVSDGNVETRYPESHVAFLYAYALGYVAGFNSLKLVGHAKKLPYEDLPEGFSLAGGRFDKPMGDALLRKGARWFLIEMKRTRKQLQSEFRKERVVRMKANLPALLGTFPEATEAHRFLYVASDGGAVRIQLPGNQGIEPILGRGQE